MHRSTLLMLTILVAPLAACSDRSAPQTAAPSPQQTSTPAFEADPGALRAKVNASGIQAQYAAHFEADQLVRIVEERQVSNLAPLRSEYAFKGARLLSYRGANLGDPEELDLQFDLQGVLQSGQGPNVSDDEIAAIRNRAQLLRSHALAQRATKMH